MPKLLDWHGWRFFFYSNEGVEPPHVHVMKDRKELKVWLRDLEIAKNARCTQKEINDIMAVVTDRKDEFLEAWNAHFGR